MRGWLCVCAAVLCANELVSLAMNEIESIPQDAKTPFVRVSSDSASSSYP